MQNSQEYFRALIQNSSDVITVVDAEGIILYQSSSIKRILGHEPEELIGKNAVEGSELLHPEDLSAKIEAFEEALRNPNTPVSVEVRMQHRDGSWQYIEETITSLLANPNVEGVVLNARCITDRKKAEKELRESEERFRSVVENTTDGVFMADLDTNTIVESNVALQNMLGYTSEELSGIRLYDIIAEDRESIDQNMQRLKGKKSLFAGERRYRHKDGSLLYVEVSASVVPFKDGEASCCIVRNVSERKALEAQLRYQAFHDSLTGLPNRALFLDRLEHALAHTSCEDEPVAVLLVDLNHFKLINDSLGHDAGNTVLVEVAERMRTSVRAGDTVGRIYGDEFAVLLEAPSGMNEAQRVAERIQECLRGQPFEVEEQEIFVSPSIGIALGGSSQDPPEEILRRADLAMYSVKKSGKAAYKKYRPIMETQVANRANLERDLRRALERDEFEVHYQPIVDLQTGRIVAFEALARWRHSRRGLVAAQEFIDVAEETGLIRPIGQRVLEEACRQAKEWCKRYQERAPVLSVNLSANQFFQQPELVPKILNETGLEPSAVLVEITEQAVMDAELALGTLKELKGLGASLALDDFGMGYSCLYHLKHMPIDFLKIDQTFIVGLGDDQGDEAIVSGTVGLAHALGVMVVAEGVETADQRMTLKELRCDLAQGYYFSEPIPSENIKRLFVENGSK